MPATTEAIGLALDVADAADDKRATDLAILEVADVLAMVDVFLLVTTGSERQLAAVAEAIEERARQQHDRKPEGREGRADGGWVLLDFGDVVCHLFSREQREFYSLERLWSDLPRIDVSSGERVDPLSVGALAEES